MNALINKIHILNGCGVRGPRYTIERQFIVIFREWFEKIGEQLKSAARALFRDRTMWAKSSKIEFIHVILKPALIENFPKLTRVIALLSNNWAAIIGNTTLRI